MIDWQRSIARPLQLKNGRTLLTLWDVHSVIEGGTHTALNSEVVAQALKLLEEAAASGGINLIERATERAHVALMTQRQL